MFEISAMLSVLKKDLHAFQRALAQLKHYYMEVTKLNHFIGESTMKFHMLGLYLMFLLAQNRIAEFHMLHLFELYSAAPLRECPSVSAPFRDAECTRVPWVVFSFTCLSLSFLVSMLFYEAQPLRFLRFTSVISVLFNETTRRAGGTMAAFSRSPFPPTHNMATTVISNYW
ncbi:unnamed protein product [Soboliphyme baturini]|uniref:Transmembrane protein n=1 Tax=Soboliphyme baturini TaxID=241478 RepID=A0A183J1W2_9BILA|nr:unnamed protein product [Soboliphyme baturini]